MVMHFDPLKMRIAPSREDNLTVMTSRTMAVDVSCDEGNVLFLGPGQRDSPADSPNQAAVEQG